MVRFFILLLLINFGFYAGASECHKLLVPSMHEIEEDPTAHLISYLNVLLGDRTIGHPEISYFKSELQEGSIRNPISMTPEIQSTVYVHYQGINDYLSMDLDSQRLLEWASATLKSLVEQHERRAEVATETQETFEKLIFHPVRPKGYVSLGVSSASVEVELTRPFEMSQTLVTQYQWASIMEANPSKYVRGFERDVVAVGENKVGMQPNHPVENVSWWHAVEFANRLSIQRGLEPVYDLSEIEVVSGPAYPIVMKGTIKINAPDGDIYQAEGYRLPTEAEWEYVARLAGELGEDNPFKEQELRDRFVWSDKNSGGYPRVVADKEGLVLGGHRFYDLWGNVWEWVHDGAWKMQGGRDPVSPDSLDPHVQRIRRGGCYLEFQLPLRSGVSSSYCAGDTGFRLVRTLK